MSGKLTVNHPARRIFRFIESCARDVDTSTIEATNDAFNELALALFAFQFEHNAPYRKLCERRGRRPSEIEQWPDIPAVPTAAFKELELSCLAPERRSHVFHSSGTTGQIPSRHFHSIASLELYHASSRPWFRRHLLPDAPSGAMELISLTPAPEQAVHSSLAHMIGVVFADLDAWPSGFAGRVSPQGDWDVDVDSLAGRLETAMADRRPVMLLGTAFNFVHLLDELRDRRRSIQLPRGSVVMETGGYKGRSRELPRAALHRAIRQQLGVLETRIVCEYGMSELSSQAYDRVAGESRIDRLFRFPPWARAHVVSPEHGGCIADGGTGLLRVFDLANAFSVMAVQTEDLAIRRGEGFELAGRAAQAEPRGCSLTSA